MALTLTSGITATTRQFLVTGTVPDDVVSGYRFRLGDELLELTAFGTIETQTPTRRELRTNRNDWIVVRGVDGLPASHTGGSEVLGSTDAFVAATSGTTPPNPFASGGGSGIPQGGPLTEDLDAGGFKVTGLADGVAASDAATVGQLGGGGNPQPTLADLGLDEPPMWAAQTHFLIAGVMSGSYGPAVYQAGGYVLAAEDYQGSGNHTGDDPPDLTGLGVGDSVPDGTYTSFILAAIGDWPPTPETWATAQTYGLDAFVWPTDPDGSLWGPYPGYPLDSDPSTTQPDFGGPDAANFLYTTDPASGGYWLRWGAANGVFGGAMPALRGQSLDIMAQGDGAAATAYVSATSDTSANGFLFVTGVGVADAIAATQAFSETGAASAKLTADRYGQDAYLNIQVSDTGKRFLTKGIPTLKTDQAGDLWNDGGFLRVLGTSGSVGPVVVVQTGAPTDYLAPLVYDDTAVTGGLYAWNGSAYVKVGGLAP